MRIQKLPNGMGVIKVDLDKAEKLRSSLLAKFVTQVGILGNKAHNRKETVVSKLGGHKVGKDLSEKTNAEIGFRNEFGVINEHIPARSFLRMPLIRNAKTLFEKKDILKKYVKKLILEGKDADASWKEAYRDLGLEAEVIIQQAFEQSGPGWPPNSPTTIALKGSDKPLIDTGALRKSISSRVLKKG